ncbi:MAG: hypothetical protein U0414_00355 [Polyangiaceae bacterium]
MPRLYARSLRTGLIWIVAAAAALSAFSCDDGNADTTSSSSSTGSGTGGSGGGPVKMVMLRIDPPTANLVVTLGSPGTTKAPFRAFASENGGPESEVTSAVKWSVSPAFGSIGADGVLTLAERGGQTNVTAQLGAATASAAITVKLVGDVFGPGTDATTKSAFDTAQADPDTSAAPAIEYPEDGVVLPGNVPPIEAQWSQASDNATYRVRMRTADTLDLSFYTTSRELTAAKDLWSLVGASTADTAVSLEVDGLGASGMVRASAPRAFTITADSIDESAIYVWQSSTGSFRVLDIQAGTDIPLPNDAPALGAGQPCSGCHRVSRDGTRFAYTYNGGNFEFGALAFDPMTQKFTQKVAPQPNVRATYATFNPLEPTTRPAMLVTVPDTVPQNTAGTVRVSLRDPDTNMDLPSDIAASIAMIDPAVGHATTMPDWSADGSFVVFAAYDSDANFVRLLGDDIVAASIVEVPVTWDAGASSFHFGAPKVLVQAPSKAAPDTDQNNFLPTISPDGSAVAFTRAAGWWSIKTQQSFINRSGQIAVVRRSDNHVFELVRGSNGPGTTLSSTWPQWAPSIGSRYLWLAFGAERPYGHRLTPTSPENGQCGFVQGQGLCKHLWVTAIDRQKLANGTDDPSSPPFWIPGQTVAAQYVSPQWTKAVIPPPQ